MKNVSFGELIVRKEVPKITKHQEMVDSIASDYLESRSPENNYTGLPVADKVSEDMYSDILLIHKKNGSVEIKLVDDNEKKKEYNVSWFKIDEKDKKPLIIGSGASYETVQKKLAAYAEKLKKLCSEYYGRLTSDPKFYNETLPKTIASAQEE